MTQESAMRPGPQSNSSADMALLTPRTLKLTTAQPARHPSPIVKATALAYVIFARPDLDKAAKFLGDFGLRVVSRTNERLLLRGTGPAPYCYIVEKAAKARFVGLGLAVDSDEALAKLAKLPGASAIEPVALPGGGRKVRLIDPAGFRVEAISGRAPVDALPHRAAILLNSPDKTVRVDEGQRPPQSAPEIIKLGHLLLEVPNYQEVAAFYTSTFGFIPSDAAVLPNGEPVATFFRLDLGDTPADHHTLALALSVLTGYGHSAYEVVDADAVGMGQRVLSDRGWKHAWGIGRHILGSQIFDYWKDAWGDKHEHYCDGDVFTSESPMGVHAMSRRAMSQWGPIVPKDFAAPKLGISELMKIFGNIRRFDDLSFKKIGALLKSIA